jgi:hypothetical protein
MTLEARITTAIQAIGADIKVIYTALTGKAPTSNALFTGSFAVDSLGEIVIGDASDAGNGTKIIIFDPDGSITFSAANLTFGGNILGSAILASTGLGYTVSAGGTVTQLTNKSTGVTLNKSCGSITMHNAALAASTSVSFTLTNSKISANDCVTVWIKSGATANAYTLTVQAVAAGSCSIQLRNNQTSGSLSEAMVLGFMIIDGVAS